MDLDIIDEHDRPTVPNPLAPALALPSARHGSRGDGAFDGIAERFFLTGDGAFDGTVTLDAPTEEEEVDGWWIEQRRRVLSRYVAAMVAVCVCLLAAGVVPR
jgi:hypothetical protein